MGTSIITCSELEVTTKDRVPCFGGVSTLINSLSAGTSPSLADHSWELNTISLPSPTTSSPDGKRCHLCRDVITTHRIYHTCFHCSHGENLLNKIWAQNSAFLSSYQVWVGIKYVLCSKCIKIILSLSSIWVFLYNHYLNDEIKYLRIKTTQVENDFSMLKGGLK